MGRKVHPIGFRLGVIRTYGGVAEGLQVYLVDEDGNAVEPIFSEEWPNV